MATLKEAKIGCYPDSSLRLYDAAEKRQIGSHFNHAGPAIDRKSRRIHAEIILHFHFVHIYLYVRHTIGAGTYAHIEQAFHLQFAHTAKHRIHSIFIAGGKAAFNAYPYARRSRKA